MTDILGSRSGIRCTKIGVAESHIRSCDVRSVILNLVAFSMVREWKTKLSVDSFHLVVSRPSSGSLYHATKDFKWVRVDGSVIAEVSEEI